MSSFPVRIFILAAVVLALAALTRYRVVEPQSITLQCAAGDAPWWCPLRDGLGRLFYLEVFGYVALAAAIAALFARRRWLIATAVAVGAAGTFLYNADMAAPALLLGLTLSFSAGRAAPR